MSKKSQVNRYKGLHFNYKINGKIYEDQYLTVGAFLKATFPKNQNPLSATMDTQIFNISWDNETIENTEKVVTVGDLKKFLQNGYIRKSTHSIEEIRELTKDVLFENDKHKTDVLLDGDLIRGNSQRYQTFFTKGLTCACCGIEGKFFAKEKTPGQDRYHLNLYAIDGNGNEVLMTKDHILPLSKGDKNNIDNYQTMCVICNGKKGNKIE